MRTISEPTLLKSMDEARRLLREEASAVEHLIERIDDSFLSALRMIVSSSGRIYILGLGKSGLVGRKIAATFSSTGTPAYFIHPVEALHGDMGLISPGDILIAISHSGGNAELIRPAKVLKQREVQVIAITSGAKSSLAKVADVVLDLEVTKEACPLGLAPTTSTTATLAMGDALAAALIVAKGFKEADFAMSHPAGTLGRRLLMTVSEVMIERGYIALISPETTIRQTVVAMSERPHGAACVVGDGDVLIGIVTDGDVRRLLLEDDLAKMIDEPISTAMTRDPIRVCASELASRALNQMEDRPSQISVLPVVEEDSDRVVGLLRLHDLIKQGMK
ncbi:KpsF/GutQ family sugar-phosphate isomerase [bacterium]|nr:KpsF/GutQ family sugar-phosphate isomerase [bacterium]